MMELSETLGESQIDRSLDVNVSGGGLCLLSFRCKALISIPFRTNVCVCIRLFTLSPGITLGLDHDKHVWGDIIFARAMLASSKHTCASFKLHIDNQCYKHLHLHTLFHWADNIEL